MIYYEGLSVEILRIVKWGRCVQFSSLLDEGETLAYIITKLNLFLSRWLLSIYEGEATYKQGL